MKFDLTATEIDVLKAALKSNRDLMIRDGPGSRKMKVALSVSHHSALRTRRMFHAVADVKAENEFISIKKSETMASVSVARVIHYADSAMGRVPTQIDYADYHPVAGVMMPFKWTYRRVSGREEYTMTEYSLTSPLTQSSSPDLSSGHNEPAPRLGADFCADFVPGMKMPATNEPGSNNS
jgi:hypothetical protein